ncbi:MAG TPA: hypothetical protein VG294_05370 [Solirubrobacteraceae bacterium]|nr:hypothetical protein [Solirubrobacteraceae bacterium]
MGTASSWSRSSLKVAEIAQRRGGNLLDVSECFRGVLRVAEGDGDAGPHVDGHERVSERVVKLARDPEPLVGYAAPAVLLAFMGFALRSLERSGVQGLARAEGIPEGERGEHERDPCPHRTQVEGSIDEHDGQDHSDRRERSHHHRSLPVAE